MQPMSNNPAPDLSPATRESVLALEGAIVLMGKKFASLEQAVTSLANNVNRLAILINKLYEESIQYKDIDEDLSEPYHKSE